MDFRTDTLYIFCHGFFSPKELKFLGRLAFLAEKREQSSCTGEIWTWAGIRIFLYNQRKLFPELKPYRMNREAYEYAVAAGAGIPLDRDKSEKLRKMDAGCLEELKQVHPGAGGWRSSRRVCCIVDKLFWIKVRKQSGLAKRYSAGMEDMSGVPLALRFLSLFCFTEFPAERAQEAKRTS